MNRLKTKTIFAILIAISIFTGTRSYAQDNGFIKYMGEIHAGYGTTSKVGDIDTYMGRVMLGTIHGIAFDRYGDVGLGVDAVMLTHYYKDQGLRFMVNPYFSVRPAYPISKKFSVFMDCTLGVSIPVVNMDGGSSEFTYQFGPGFRFKRMNISLGVQGIGSGEGSTTFFAKLGINLGRQ